MISSRAKIYARDPTRTNSEWGRTTDEGLPRRRNNISPGGVYRMAKLENRMFQTVNVQCSVSTSHGGNNG